MKKIISALLAAVMLAGLLAVSAGACFPFPGADILTVTQVGEPVADAAVALYRVNAYGGEDTFLGTFRTDDKGIVSAGHLTTGLYRWVGEGAEVLFRVTGAGFVRTALELPAPAPEDGREHMTYMSADGYQIRYNALNVESYEIDDHSAKFVILGDEDEANAVTVSWIEGKQPEEVLYEITSLWGDQEAITRSEGLFPGTTDKWGYWRTFADGDLVKCAIAGEYNGGVLLFVIESRLTGDEGKDMTVSDILAEIIDSITYFDFEAQTMYDYVPGTYISTGEDMCQVVLNADHTGTLQFQDTVDVLWGSIELTGNGFSYAYTIEGDYLYVDLDGIWAEFARQPAEE